MIQFTDWALNEIALLYTSIYWPNWFHVIQQISSRWERHNIKGAVWQ